MKVRGASVGHRPSPSPSSRDRMQQSLAAGIGRNAALGRALPGTPIGRLVRRAVSGHPPLLSAILVACSIGGPAVAQTTDPIFRSWRWTEEVTTPRALGLGGAIAGLADDGAAAAFNPAGLATIPAAGELQIGVRLRSEASPANGDRVRELAKVTSPATFVLRVGPRVALSYHFVQLRSASRIAFQEGRESGTLNTTINGPGIGLGVRVLPFLNLGLSLDALRFYINDGGYLRGTDAGRTDLAVRLNSNGDTRVTGTVGALITTRELSYGFVFRLGARWRGLRTASDPSTRQVIDEGSVFDVGSPSVCSGGISWRPELRRAQTFLLTAQVDRLLLGSIRPTAAPGLDFPASDYQMKSAFDWRVGAETTLPLPAGWVSHIPGSPNRIQLRAGWHRAAAGALVYTGSDPVEIGVFPRADARNLWSLGMSFGGATIWRLSGAYRFGGDDKQVAVGIAIRYPGLFP